MQTKLPALGVGLTYIPGIEPILDAGDGLVDVLEIEPQTLWFQRGPSEFRVDDVALHRLQKFSCAKLLHGVGFPIGGTHPPNPTQIPLLRQMIETLDVPWLSEHLGFNQARGPDGDFKTGFLLPSRQSSAGVAAAVASVQCMARNLPVPLAAETSVSYLRPRRDEMADGEFVAAVAQAADCGILLDLHNIWTNQINGRQPVTEFLASIPLQRVWEMHIAGGTEHGQFWLDAHSGPVPPALMELARRIVPTLPNLRAIIFEISPSYLPVIGIGVIRDQLRLIRELWQDRQTVGLAKTGLAQSLMHFVGSIPEMARRHDEGPSPTEWEDTLAAAVIGRTAKSPLGAELASDPGVAVVRDLVGEFRASMVVGALKLTSRLLMLTLGTDRFKSLLAEYWSQSTPKLFGSAEADAFAAFLRTRSLPVEHLEPVLEFESAVIATLIDQQIRIVKFDFNPMQILGALGEGRLPNALIRSDFEVEITPQAAARHSDRWRTSGNSALPMH